MDLDPATSVADRFDGISSRCAGSGRPVGLSHNEQVLWYVVAARCEMDINGFESVFDQLLSEREVKFLVEALDELQEEKASASFKRAHDALCRVGFYEQAGAMCGEFGQKLCDELKAIEAELNAENRMWALDEKLALLDVA